MASTLRTARSNAAPAAPAGRGPDGAARPAARPQLHVIDGSSPSAMAPGPPAAWPVSSPGPRRAVRH